MAVHIKLKPEWNPCRNTKVAESEVRVDEVKIVVQAFSSIRFQEGLTGLFIMPRLIAGTHLHGREDMNESRMSAALFR